MDVMEETPQDPPIHTGSRYGNVERKMKMN